LLLLRQAAGEIARLERARLRDEPARSVDLLPDVPKENATNSAAAEIIHDALAVRIRPVLDRLQPRVKFPDRLVA